MISVFNYAPEVEEIAETIIQEHHLHLLDCAVRVVYVFTDKPKKSKGKTALGYVQVVSNLHAFLSAATNKATGERVEDAYFVMVIWRAAWKYQLSEKQRVALIDHELCHLWAEEDEKTGEVKLSLLPHDCEEFTAVIRRHGVWLDDVDAIVKAAEAGPQLTFAEIAKRTQEEASASLSLLPGGRQTTSVTLKKGDFDTLKQASRKLRDDSEAAA